jgi:serine/threonine protein kinase
MTSSQSNFVINCSEKLGFGNFGTVYPATRKSDGVEFAAKVFKAGKSKRCSKEIAIMKHLALFKLRNVVEIAAVEYFEGEVALIMEVLTGGDVLSRILELGNFSERRAAHIMCNLAQGLYDLHNVCGVIHRDIKPENLVFVNNDVSDIADIKLIDFGLSVRVGPKDNIQAGLQIGQRPVGTRTYMAPETVQYCRYSAKTDTWSAGVILYVLLTGISPFDQKDLARQKYQIVNGKYHPLSSSFWRKVSDGAKDLVTKMLVVDPAERITPEEILVHPWIRQQTYVEDSDFGTDYVRRLRSLAASKNFTKTLNAVVFLKSRHKVPVSNLVGITISDGFNSRTRSVGKSSTTTALLQGYQDENTGSKPSAKRVEERIGDVVMIFLKIELEFSMSIRKTNSGGSTDSAMKRSESLGTLRSTRGSVQNGLSVMSRNISEQRWNYSAMSTGNLVDKAHQYPEGIGMPMSQSELTQGTHTSSALPSALTSTYSLREAISSNSMGSESSMLGEGPEAELTREIFFGTIHVYGGQVRQLMLDDTGFLCVGTFGPNVSMISNEDNCAAAVEASFALLHSLEAVGLIGKVSIVTTEASRIQPNDVSGNEFSINERSIKVASQLLTRTRKKTVKCDLSTREGDRMHSFLVRPPTKVDGIVESIFRPIEVKEVSSQVPTLSPAVLPTSASGASTSIAAGNTDDESNEDRELMTHVDGREESVYGRSAELTQLVGFLKEHSIHRARPMYDGDSVATFQTGGVSIPSTIRTETTSSSQSDCGTMSGRHIMPAKLVVVTGSVGVGKSSFVRALCDVLTSSASSPTRGKQYVTTVVKAYATPVENVTQFYPWKKIFVDTMGILSGFLSKKSAMKDADDARGGLCLDRSAKSRLGFEYITAQLQPTMRDRLPLLTYFNFPVEGLDEHSNPHTISKLSGSEKVSCMIELMSLIIQHVSNLLLHNQSYFAIAIDDLQFIDSSSWQLLLHVWKNNRDIWLLTTLLDTRKFWTDNYQKMRKMQMRDFQRMSEEPFNPLATLPPLSAEKVPADILKLLTDETNLVRFMFLGPVSQQALSQLASNIFSTAVSPSAPQLNAREKELKDNLMLALHSVSGGNSLHAAEVAVTAARVKSGSSRKNMLEELKALIEQVRANKSHGYAELIRRRVDLLTPSCREFLKVAAVLAGGGSTFTVDSLIDLVLTAMESRPSIVLTITADLGSDILDRTKVTALVYRLIMEIFERDTIIRRSDHEATSGFVQGHASVIEARSSESSDDAMGITIKTRNKTRCSMINEADVDEEFMIHGRTELDFFSDLHQSVIYDLNSDEDKVWLHSCLALSMEKSAVTGLDEGAIHQSQRASIWHIQGYHWQHAQVWNKALACFYETAMVLDSQGSLRDSKMYFCWAYNMLKSMYLRASLPVHHAFDISTGQLVTYPAASPQDADSSRPSSAESLHQDISQQNDVNDGNDIITAIATGRFMISIDQQARPTALCPKNVYDIFSGDVLSLETAIMMLIRYAQYCITMQEGISVYALILNEALELIMMSLKSTVMVSSLRQKKALKHIPSLSPSLHNRQTYSDKGSNSFAEDNDIKFYIRDFALIFPILSTITMQYLGRYLPDDAENSKQNRLCEVFMALAKDFGKSLYLIRAHSLNIVAYGLSHKYKEAIMHADEMRVMYNYSEHSEQLISTFGADRALHGLAYAVQYRILLCDFKQAQINMMVVRAHLAKTRHMHTLSVSILPMCIGLIFANNFDMAATVFLEYYQFENVFSGFSYFRSWIPYYMELMISMSAVSVQEKDQMRQSIDNGEWRKKIRLISEEGPIATVRSPPGGGKGGDVTVLELFGLGVDAVKGWICLIRANEMLQRANSGRQEFSMTAMVKVLSSADVIHMDDPNYSHLPHGHPMQPFHPYPYPHPQPAEIERDDTLAEDGDDECLEWGRAVSRLCYTGLYFVESSYSANPQAVINRIMCLQIKSQLLAVLAAISVDDDDGREMTVDEEEELAAILEERPSNNVPGFSRRVCVNVATDVLRECADMSEEVNSPLIELWTGLLLCNLNVEFERGAGMILTALNEIGSDAGGGVHAFGESGMAETSSAAVKMGGSPFVKEVQSTDKFAPLARKARAFAARL